MVETEPGGTVAQEVTSGESRLHVPEFLIKATERAIEVVRAAIGGQLSDEEFYARVQESLVNDDDLDIDD